MIHNLPKISIIAAIGKNRELGRGNKLLFQIPEDMKFFREKTRGHAIIMGRKTYESIGRPLPNRTNIVVTRDKMFQVPLGVELADSIEKALEIAKNHEEKEIFVIGGAQIYQLAMPYADKLYLTVVNEIVKDADAFFPDYSEFGRVVSRKAGQDENYRYDFFELVRD